MTAPPEEGEPRDPGLAGERTELAWRRTGIAFTALAAALVKADPALGLPTLAASGLVWTLTHRRPPGSGPARPLLTTAAVVALSALALITVTP